MVLLHAGLQRVEGRSALGWCSLGVRWARQMRPLVTLRWSPEPA